MEIKRKYVVVGLILLALAWGGNIYVYQRHMLKEPVFLKHYYDLKPGIGIFWIYYIDNINPRDGVVSVTFPELEPGLVYSEIIETGRHNSYYSMKSIQVGIFEVNPSEVSEDSKEKVITKVRLHFDSGKTRDFNVGDIYINTFRPYKHNFDYTSAEMTSENSSSTKFSSSKTVRVYGTSSKYPELIDDLIEIRINGELLKNVKFPITVNMGETITVDYKFKFEEWDARKNNAYNFTFNLLTEDLMGEQGMESIRIDHYPQLPEKYVIDEMIRDGGIEQHV